MPQVESALTANNDNAGGGFYSQGGQFYYVRGMGRMERWRTSATWCWRCITALRCWSRTSAAWSSASPRASASSAIEKQDDAVEGVILLRTGEKTQDVLKRVEAKTQRAQRADPAQGRQSRCRSTTAAIWSI